jgi:hypothetical protein
MAARKQIVMVDVDDTLYDFKRLFHVKASELYPGEAPDPASQDTWSDLFNAMIAIDARRGDKPGTAFSIVLAACFEDEAILSNRAHDGAAEVLGHLAESYDLWYVTDRPQSAHAATVQWMDTCGIPMSHQLVCTSDKREWMNRRKGQIYTVIDDRPRTMIHALHAVGCPHVHSLGVHWNSDLSDVEGVYVAANWHEIGANIERLTQLAA